MMPTADPRFVAGAAIAETVLASAGGSLGLVASQVLAQGLAFWSDYAGRMSKGLLTADDVRMAAALTQTDMTKLETDIANAAMATRIGFPPLPKPV